MLITYKFNDGAVSNVEVDDEIGSVIIQSRKEEHANNEKQRSHCLSIDAVDYEGMSFATSDNVDSITSIKESNEEFYEIYDTLTEIQKRRVELLEMGFSFREIARKEDVSDHKKIKKSIEQVRKKFEKFKNRGPKTAYKSAYSEGTMKDKSLTHLEN